MAKKILVIDDDYLVIKSVERYLKTKGYTVEAVDNGKAALEKAKDSDFDLIISDIRMPGMDGLETIKRIRESTLRHNKEKTPAIIITGYAGAEVEHRLGELGIAECVYKPFELEQFIQVIKKNLELPPKYKRDYPRITAAFPVEATVRDSVTAKTLTLAGRMVDLSEKGIGLMLDSLLLPPVSVTVYVNSAPRYPSFQVEAQIVWSKPFFKDGYFRAGLHILKIDENNLATLREILSDYKLLDGRFISLTNNMKDFLQSLKNRLDDFDAQNSDLQKRIAYIELIKEEAFEQLDDYFEEAWEMVKDFEKDKYFVHQNYYQQILHPLFEKDIEINRHIYRKPLGYPGDYVMMNYIYDYNGNNNYLGDSSYEKIVNNYTCNIPISCSNIQRKTFLKEKIVETLQRRDKPKILSIACGPARELIELLKEDKINKPLLFKCLDFEKRVLDYIRAEINKIELPNKCHLSIEYICRDITGIIRDKKLKEELREQDLIYAFGIFDYLGDRMAERLTKELYQLLERDGKLIICNASLENSSHRAYYELLGEWNMVHRTKEQMLIWENDIEDVKEIKFEEPAGGNNYLFLSIEKT